MGYLLQDILSNWLGVSVGSLYDPGPLQLRGPHWSEDIEARFKLEQLYELHFTKVCFNETHCRPLFLKSLL
jgi:hypothetical protein